MQIAKGFRWLGALMGFSFLALAGCAPPSCGGSTWTATSVSNTNVARASDTVTLALSGLSTGSLIAVHTSVFDTANVASTMTVSDGTNGSYSQSYYNIVAGGAGAVGLHYFAGNKASSITITANPNASSADIWIAAQEFCVASIPASPASGSPVGNSGLGTTVSSGSMTPADNNVLLLSGFMGLTTGTVNINAGGEGFTQIAEHETPTMGSFVYKIISGAPSSSSHSWTIPEGSWTAGIGAFKPTTAAPTS